MTYFWIGFVFVAVLIFVTYRRMRREYRDLGRWGDR